MRHSSVKEAWLEDRGDVTTYFQGDFSSIGTRLSSSSFVFPLAHKEHRLSSLLMWNYIFFHGAESKKLQAGENGFSLDQRHGAHLDSGTTPSLRWVVHSQIETHSETYRIEGLLRPETFKGINEAGIDRWARPVHRKVEAVYKAWIGWRMNEIMQESELDQGMIDDNWSSV